MRFSNLLSGISVEELDDGTTVSLSKECFARLLRAALDGITIDESWYLANNQDVSEAIARGTVLSARDHFVTHGFFEGRLPQRVTVDEAFYLDDNPDVKAAIAEGTVDDAQSHFEENGAREGRLPYPGFSYFKAKSRKLRGTDGFAGRALTSFGSARNRLAHVFGAPSL